MENVEQFAKIEHNFLKLPSLLADACAAIAQISHAELLLFSRFLSSLVGCGGVLHIFANGGLAAEAAHLWTDCHTTERQEPLPRVVVPSCNGALLTMLANDFPPDQAVAQYVARGTEPGDGFMVMSHSGGAGRSTGLVLGTAAAQARGLSTFAITSRSGVALARYADTVVMIGTDGISPPAFEVAVSAYFHAALDEVTT
jgi:phosphoheptose isomerase